MLVERICIVGAGLMGGSLALALRLAQRTAVPRFPLHLTLVEKDAKTRTAVSRLGDVVTDDLAAGVQDAGLVILATPVRAIVRLLAQLPALRPDGCLVLDLGSSKAAIGAAMAALPNTFAAIGGHPMCGRETAGFGAATPDLYRNQTFVLCKNGRTTDYVEQQARALLALIGARPLLLPADVHDMIVAAVSHLPYLAAAALINTAAQVGDPHVWPVSASGFRDTSRVAGTDPTMMLDILLTNKTAVLDQLSGYESQLAQVRQYIEQEDEAALAQWLAQTQRKYETYKRQKK